jgi:hypothetical protein
VAADPGADPGLIGAPAHHPVDTSACVIGCSEPRVTLPAHSASGAGVDHSVGLEMRVWGGTVEQHPERLPRPLSAWELHDTGGKRSGPLPAIFSASGNLRLIFAFVADEQLVITGSRLTLRLLKRPLKRAPSSRGNVRPASRRVQLKLRRFNPCQARAQQQRQIFQWNAALAL